AGLTGSMPRTTGWPRAGDLFHAAMTRGKVPNPSKGYGPVKLGPLLGFMWFGALHGRLRTPKLHEVATFRRRGATLDVPGSPQVILAPGHTPGSAALHVASLGPLFIGDAFATHGVTTGAPGVSGAGSVNGLHKLALKPNA